MSDTKPDYIAEAIGEAFGSRCPGFIEGCACCEAWQQYDALTALRAELVAARTELGETQLVLEQTERNCAAEVERLTRERDLARKEVDLLLSSAAAKGDEPDLLLCELDNERARATTAEAEADRLTKALALAILATT